MPAPRALITGAAGFAGPWLAAALLERGWSVTGLSRRPPEGLPARLPGFTGEDSGDRAVYTGPAGSWTCLAGDVTDTDGLHELLASERPDHLFHLAARSSAGASFARPAETLAVNAGGTLAVLEAVRRLPAGRRPRVVVVGSADEYGAPDQPRPLAEGAPLRPVSPYGASKAAATLLGRQYHAAHGLDVVVARPFSHIGPGQAPQFLFPSLARQIVAAERGSGPTELLVGDLSPRRDYLHVADVALAYVALALRGRPGRVYNICSGRGIALHDAASLLTQQARVPVTLRPDPARVRPADIPYLVGDPTRLIAETDWQQQRGIAAALHELLDWTRETT